MAADSVRTRLAPAQSDFRRLTGAPATGFLPPAWQLPVDSAQLDAFRYVLRYGRIESCVDPDRVRKLKALLTQRRQKETDPGVRKAIETGLDSALGGSDQGAADQERAPANPRSEAEDVVSGGAEPERSK